MNKEEISMSTPFVTQCNNCGESFVFLRKTLTKCPKCGYEHSSHRDPDPDPTQSLKNSCKIGSTRSKHQPLSENCRDMFREIYEACIKRMGISRC